MIRILVVDDHAVVREGLRHVLTAEHGLEVVAEAGDAAAGLAKARELAPDVILLDITMPGITGLDALARFKADAPGARVLLLTMHDHGEYVVEAIRAGADGYLLKDSAPADLRAAIRAVQAGERQFGPGVSAALAEGLAAEAARTEQDAVIGRLTPREREVMAQVAAGRTNKEAGVALGISPRTVETHRENLMKKLGIRSVAELTRFAVAHGITTR